MRRFILCILAILCLGIPLVSEAALQKNPLKDRQKRLSKEVPDPVKWGGQKQTLQNKGGFTENITPLGILGAYARITVGKTEGIVIEVVEDGVAAKGGLLVGDAIVGVNEKPIDLPFTAAEGDGGQGLQESVGFGIEEALASKDRTLKLTVERAGKKKELKIKLPDVKPYGPLFPFPENPKNEYDQRSAEVLAALIDRMVRLKGDRQGFGIVQTATAGLAFLASYDLSLSPHIRDFATYINSLPPESPGGLPAWGLNYGTTFLCEYFYATNDKSVLPFIEERMKISADWISEEGKVGHGKEVGYKHLFPPNGSGINIIGCHHFMNFGLANHIGIPVDKDAWERNYTHTRRCQAGQGQVGYICASGWDETSGITGLAAIGFMLHDKKEDHAMHTTECWVNFDGEITGLKCMRNSHANSSFGHTWGISALAALRSGKKDPGKGYRVAMDYWKWYFSLSEAPANSDIVHYFIPSKGNTGGDGYLGFDLICHASHALCLASAKKSLIIHGGKRRNWYNKQALLERLGLWDKVQRLQKDILALEKKENYKKAWEKLLELKKIDEEHDFVYEKPRNWRQLANTELNRVLPALADRNYYIADKECNRILKKYGEVLAPRAKFFGDAVDKSELLPDQKRDGFRIERVFLEFDEKQISAAEAVRKLTPLLKPHKGTGFYRDYMVTYNKYREQAEREIREAQEKEAGVDSAVSSEAKVNS